MEVADNGFIVRYDEKMPSQEKEYGCTQSVSHEEVYPFEQSAEAMARLIELSKHSGITVNVTVSSGPSKAK